jgi:hypothetical protein
MADSGDFSASMTTAPWLQAVDFADILSNGKEMKPHAAEDKTTRQSV